ncbi:MAG: excinuclease ABC subunit UvrA [Limisphaerales bacterium]
MAESSTQAAAAEVIAIHGAREHNLKNISLTIPRNQFVVVTGLSGSGKSTLAFDLLFAEGQRRFLDSMNVYARQFIDQLARPEVDLITGIPPSVSIEQRQSRGGGKSTVATVTEIYHFMRLLFARLGTQFCPQCQCPVQSQTRDQVGRKLAEEMRRRGDLLLLAPIVKNRKGFHTEVASWAAQHGYAEVRADGKMHPTDRPLRLDRFREHDVEIVVGRLDKTRRPTPSERKAAQDLIDRALELGRGTVHVLANDGKTSIHSTERSCPSCGQSFEPLDPKMFSYNSSRGWCPTCRGFGEIFYLPDVERGARAGAIEESWFDWQEGEREICQACQGTRLNAVARAVRLRHWKTRAPRAKNGPEEDSPTIVDLSNASVDSALAWARGLRLHGREAEIARDILPEIRERLKFLREVGLGYLQLGRGATTLSGGESQRIRLAAQLGSNLSGVLYILDEPTIGLHARDNEKLLDALDLLKARGNSLLVVEHDEATMRRADYIIDLGPGAGVNGGEVVAAGSWKELMAQERSVTAQCLRSIKSYPAQGLRRAVGPDANPPALTLAGASLHNLKNLTVNFPLHRFICLTGVSGSGKSTLLRDCLLPAVRARLARPRKASAAKGTTGAVTGAEALRAVYEVDQSPIGRTVRSVPATYAGFFDEIRQLFAQTPEARLRGYSASRFSFNSPQGRCPECLGAGTIKLEMSFMPPAFVRCETCQGTRFNLETLEVQFHHLNIAEVLDLSVGQALQIFAPFPKIARALEALRDTGLDYIKLGQSSPTLSGGEAQRLKIVAHLLAGFRKPDTPELLPPGRSNLFLLEEPTVGLHMADVKRLVEALQRLVDAGHTVIVIEHNLELIAEADWVIDLGPEGGEEGGRVVGVGTPETLAKNKRSHTGRFLRRLLSSQLPRDGIISATK